MLARLWAGSDLASAQAEPPKNVPEFEPAFPRQTRAPRVESRTRFDVREVADGFDRPWALAFLPDGRMLVTEKHVGQLWVLTAAGEKQARVQGLPPVDGRGQGGLLEVALSPDYATTRRIYWTYAEPRDGGNGLAVARGALELQPRPRLREVEVIFRMQPTLESTAHSGGRLVFAPDDTLFVTLGERSILKGRVQAQDLGSHLGKIVRLKHDGSVPKDNPFVGTKGARPEIWTQGHRNVLGATLDTRGRLWAHEMGPRGGDELNLIRKGRDYGWPTIGYGEEYDGSAIHDSPVHEGMEQPVYYWDPSVSPSGLIQYTGEAFPEWRGNFFLGALSGQALVRLVVKEDRVVGEERLLSGRARIRDVVQGPDGAIYLLTDGEDAELWKLVPKKK